MYSPRVKEYLFGAVSSTAGSLLYGSTVHPINGEIVRVAYDAANFVTGGSVWLQTKDGGFVENIGSFCAILNADTVIYPSKANQDGTTRVSPVVVGHIYYSGIGIGSLTSGTLSFYYR